MKKTKFTFLFTLLFSAILIAQKKVTILGSGFNKYNSVTLSAYNSEKLNYDDLMIETLEDDGTFEIKINFKNVNLYRLSFDEKSAVYLSVENPGKIEVLRDNSKTTIHGSESSQKMLVFKKQNQQLQGKHFGDLKTRMDKAMKNNDKEEIQKLRKESQVAIGNFLTEFRALIVDLGETPAGYYAIQFSDFNKELDFIDSRLSEFKKSIPNSPVTKALNKQVYQAKNTAVGKTPPSFKAMDITNKEIVLSDFTGKIVLLDFWAHWCRECRIENPKFADIYEAYKDKDFVVISISKPVPEKKWKSAIEKDNIKNFINILDVEDELSDLYSVSSLPQNLLIDTSGKIIAKNVDAVELRKMLSKKN